MSIESEIKKQYQKIFSREDCDGTPFKQMADYYLEIASTLTTQKIDAPKALKLWIRNVQKRLYIGIGTELLLKSIFIDEGYNINKPKRGKKFKFPELLQKIDENILNPSDTYSMSQLIDALPKITDVSDPTLKGLKICKVFRNKEGHVAIHWHSFDSINYAKISNSIIRLYRDFFDEDLDIKIGFVKGESGHFKKQTL